MTRLASLRISKVNWNTVLGSSRSMSSKTTMLSSSEPHLVSQLDGPIWPGLTGRFLSAQTGLLMSLPPTGPRVLFRCADDLLPRFSGPLSVVGRRGKSPTHQNACSPGPPSGPVPCAGVRRSSRLVTPDLVPSGGLCGACHPGSFGPPGEPARPCVVCRHVTLSDMTSGCLRTVRE